MLQNDGPQFDPTQTAVMRSRQTADLAPPPPSATVLEVPEWVEPRYFRAGFLVTLGACAALTLVALVYALFVLPFLTGVANSVG